MWENPPSADTFSWSDAGTYCEDLDLVGFTDWRFPSARELRTLIRGCPATESHGSCNVEETNCLAFSCRNDGCRGCADNGGPADGCYWPVEIQGTCGWYWSSASVAEMSARWGVDFGDGSVIYISTSNSRNVRCVR